MSIADVHPDLKDLYQKYKILGVGLVVCSILPPASLFIMYGTQAGVHHLVGSRMLIVVVAFVLEVPLLLALAYFISLKRMCFLERSTQVVKSGVTREIYIAGAYKMKTQSGNMALVLDLAVDDNSDVERFTILPKKDLDDYIASCPDLPADSPPKEKPGSTENARAQKIRAYIDSETRRPVAVELDCKTGWISPPPKLI